MKMLALIALLAACGGQIKVAPVTVKPIHMTIDVNLHDKSDEPPPTEAER